MLGFIADYASGDLVAQADEIEALGWFGFARLPNLPHPASLARRMIEHVRVNPSFRMGDDACENSGHSGYPLK
jgi:NADH pyrophosphatase NudC (nudix superfamily)